MSEKEIRYFINLDRIISKNRSFTIIIKGHLCPKCQKKKDAELEKKKPDELIKMIKNCCSNSPDFITSRTPVYEKLFRIFLASGNQPLTVAELVTKLQTYAGASASLSEAALKRLLHSDQNYGFSQYD